MLSDLNIIICVILEVPFVELKEFFVLQKPCFLLVMNHFICRVKRIRLYTSQAHAGFL